MVFQRGSMIYWIRVQTVWRAWSGLKSWLCNDELGQDTPSVGMGLVTVYIPHLVTGSNEFNTCKTEEYLALIKCHVFVKLIIIIINNVILGIQSDC